MINAPLVQSCDFWNGTDGEVPFWEVRTDDVRLNEKSRPTPFGPAASDTPQVDPLCLIHAGAIALASRAGDLHPGLAAQDADEPADRVLLPVRGLDDFLQRGPRSSAVASQ